MRKNLKVIQINGFRGIFMAIFVVCCLIAGFIAFPALVTMHVWNYLAIKTGSFPAITFAAGVLLWAIISFSVYLFNKRKLIVSFSAPQELSEDEVKNVLSRIKSQTNMLMPKDFNIEKETKEEIEFSTDKKD